MPESRPPTATGTSPAPSASGLTSALSVPTGKFTIAVGLWAPPTKAYTTDKQDTSFYGPVWAQVDVVADGRRDDVFWYGSGGADEEKTKSKVLESQNSKDVLRFEYSQSSKPVPLTEASVKALSEHFLLVSVFCGKSQDAGKDTKIGWIKLPMAKAVLGQGLDGMFDLTPDTATQNIPLKDSTNPEEESREPEVTSETTNTQQQVCPSIEIMLQLSLELSNFALGATIMWLKDTTITRIPASWQLNEDGASPEQLLQDTAKNVAKFCLSINNPVNASRVYIADGVLEYKRPTLHPDAEMNAEDLQATNGTSAQPAPAGHWQVTFPKPVAIWFSREETKILKQLIPSDVALQIEAERVIPSMVDDKKPSATKPGKVAAASVKTNPTPSAAKTAQNAAVSEAVSEAPTVPLAQQVWKLSSRASLLGLLEPDCSAMSIASSASYTELESTEVILSQIDSTADETIKRVWQSKLACVEQSKLWASDQADALQKSGTQIELSVSLSNPLVLSPVPPPPPVLRPADLIMRRDPPPPYPPQDVLREFQSEINTIAKQVAEQYQKILQAQSSEGGAASYEEMRAQLFYVLNSEQIYHSFKERLKGLVVRLVKERYPEAPSLEAEGTFYSDLYSFLVDQVNESLNCLFAAAEPTIPNPKLAKEEVSYRKDPIAFYAVLASEAEAQKDWGKAQKCHLDRISAAEANAKISGHWNAEVWFDYSCFSLRKGDVDVAVKGLRECLSIEPDYSDALRLYGAVLCSIGDYDKAEVMLKGVLNVESIVGTTLPISHALLAVYFKRSGVDIRGRMTLSEITTASDHGGTSKPAICYALAEYFLDHNILTLVSDAFDLAKIVLTPEEEPINRLRIRLIRARVSMLEGRFVEAMDLAEQATQLAGNSSEAWYIAGQVQMQLNNSTLACEYYNKALFYIEKTDSKPPLALFLQLGQLYLQSSQPAIAKEVLLRGCKLYTLPCLWLLVGVACLRLEQYQESEDALTEANVLDNTNTEVWGYLALLCLSVSPPRLLEANQALDQALRLGLMNASVLRELGTLYTSLDKLEVAEGLLRRSLGAHDSSATRKRLADVLQAQNCAEAALTEYQLVLNNCEDIRQRCETLEQCAKLLTTLGRYEEATKYRQLSLQQSELI